MCPGCERHDGDDGVDLDRIGPLLPDVTPSGSVMASSFILPLVTDFGAPNRGDHVVPADDGGEDGLALLAQPVQGVPVTAFSLLTVRLLFFGLA